MFARARVLPVVLVAMTLVLPLWPSSATLADDLGAANNKRDQLNGSIGGDRTRIKQIQGQEAALQQRLTAVTAQIRASEDELARQNARLDALLGQIDQTQRQLEAKRAEQARRQEILNRRTRVMYKRGGNATFLDTLFTAKTFSELLDRFIVMRDITHADEELVIQIQHDREAIEALAAQLAQSRDQQQQVVNAIQAQTESLRGRYAEESALRRQLAGQEASLEQQVAQAEQALAQVNAEIAALQAARGRAHSSGVLAWPGVQGPITQGFGCTDFRGEPPPPPGYSCPLRRPYFHTGIDIAGPYGSEVDAADGGIAYTYSGSSGYGNHIILIHANGFATLYGHLSGFAINSGSAVRKGERIGYEGSTGFSSGPHLHFEVRLNDVPQDPCRYVGC